MLDTPIPLPGAAYALIQTNSRRVVSKSTDGLATYHRPLVSNY